MRSRRASNPADKPRKPPRGRVSYTGEFREAAFAKLLANGGSIKRTAEELGIQRLTLMNWLDKYRDVYEAVRAAYSGDLLQRLKHTRSQALKALDASIERALEDIANGVDTRARLADIAKAMEIVDRIHRATEGGGESGRPKTDPDPGATTAGSEAVGAILGPGDGEEPAP